LIEMGKLKDSVKDFLKRITGFRIFGSGFDLAPSNPPPTVPGTNVPSQTEKETVASDIVSHLFDDQNIPRLVIKWRDKILGKVEQLKTSGIDTVKAKERLASYLRKLAQERERYVRESRQQIKTVPDNIRKQHPEGGLSVELGVAGAVFAFADHIKASEALLEVLPKIIKLCGSTNTTLQSISDDIKTIFNELLFQIE